MNIKKNTVLILPLVALAIYKIWINAILYPIQSWSDCVRNGFLKVYILIAYIATVPWLFGFTLSICTLTIITVNIILKDETISAIKKIGAYILSVLALHIIPPLIAVAWVLFSFVFNPWLLHIVGIKVGS